MPGRTSAPGPPGHVRDLSPRPPATDFRRMSVLSCRPVIGAGLAVLALSGVAVAQDPGGGSPPPLVVAEGAGPREEPGRRGETREPDTATPAADAADSVPGAAAPARVDPNVIRALGEIAVANVVAIGVNVLWREEPATHPGSWWDNVRGGWEWDPNPIRVNAFEHPWAGAAYYNIARANGLSFYGAYPATLAGSLMWELFGEPRPPSINDLVFTSVGGVALGEPMRRLSHLILDETATGMPRFWREAAVFVTNPGLGLDRLSRGRSWKPGDNGSLVRPSTPLRGGIGIGGRSLRAEDGTTSSNADAAVIAFDVEYGDRFAPPIGGPFSWFAATAELSSLSPVLTQAGVRGNLAELARREGDTDRVLGLYLDFDYRWDGFVAFSEQSFGLGFLTRTGDAGLRLQTEAGVELVPMLASSERRASEVTARSYEFATGVGARLGLDVAHRGRTLLSADYRTYWAVTLDGASRSKRIQLATIEARAPLPADFYLGAGYRLHLQRASFEDGPVESVSVPSLSLTFGTGG